MPHPALPLAIALTVVAIIAWVANYLHFTQFGLYEDDWFYGAWAFEYPPGKWLATSLQYLVRPGESQGRPLQFFFNCALPILGALVDSFAVNYAIGYLLFAGSAVLLYRVLRHRFGGLVALLATLLFVLTPLHTLRQFLNGQYGFGPAFLFVFGAILLYQRGRRCWPWLLAPLSLLSYESIYFLWLGAPLLARGRAFRGRLRHWLWHAGAGVAVVAVYFVARKYWFHESRVAGLSTDGSLVGGVLRDWTFYMLGSFGTYYEAARRAVLAPLLEAWLWCVPALALTGWAAMREARRLAPRRQRLAAWIASTVRPFATGLVLLALGYATAHFFGIFTAGRFPYTDRLTRISVAASVGSSLMLAGLLAGLLRQANGVVWRALVGLVATALVAVSFVYSFQVQSDYVTDWRSQRATMRAIVDLTPEARRDSFILLRLPFVGPGTAGAPGIGQDLGAFERQIGNSFSGGAPELPRLFIVMGDDWPRFLKRQPDGLMNWTQAEFTGRWYEPPPPFRADRFLRLERFADGRVVRHAAPIVVDGVTLSHPPAEPGDPGIWRTRSLTRLGRKLLQ